MSHIRFLCRFNTYRRKAAAEAICHCACPNRAGQMRPEPHQIPGDWSVEHRSWGTDNDHTDILCQVFYCIAGKPDGNCQQINHPNQT